MANRNVNLPEHFDRFITRSIAAGRFLDMTDAVVEGLRLLEQKELAGPPLERLGVVSGLPVGELDAQDGIEFESVADFLELLAQMGVEGPAQPIH